jgi:DnaJ-class molecular chaperone
MTEILGHGRKTYPIKARSDTCGTCLGRGYTRDTAPYFKDGKTIKLGSGCPTCKGVGRVCEHDTI